MLKTFVPFFSALTLCFFNHIQAEDPALLNDEAEIHQYLIDFPYSLYKVYNVPGQGYFFLDDIDDVIKNFLKQGMSWESHLMPLIEQYVRPGSVAIDVGAHIGTFTILLAHKVGPTGQVYAFEPQKKIFRELWANCILNNVHNVVKMKRFAIGDVHSIVEMSPSVHGNEAGTGLGIGGDKVEMRTLDSFQLTNVSLIKIDVEGGENKVIDGMVNTLKENRPAVIIEICGGHLWGTASPQIREQIIYTKNKLQNLGYVVLSLGGHDYLALPLK